MSKYFRWAELPARKDVYTHVGTTTWGNHDLYPIPRKERQFSWFSYLAFMFICTTNITCYSLGSTYIALGLTAAQTIGCVVGGTAMAGFYSYITARPGLDHGIGFTVWLRSVFGLRGAYLPIAITSAGGVIYAGLQAYYGAQSLSLLLGAVIPAYARIPNTLPAAAALTTRDLVSLLLYYVIYVPVLWFVEPHRMRRILYPGLAVVAAVMFGLLIWALRTTGGSLGPLITGSPIPLSSADRAFRVAQCLITILGILGGSSERFSDWSRFARSRQAPTLALLLGVPLGVAFSVTVGCVVTSAMYEHTGEIQWNPLVLLQDLQDRDYTPAVRAATFFAGLALAYCQVIVNGMAGTVGWSMDLCGVLPKYLSMQRAALLQTVLVLLSQPWRFLQKAEILAEILSIFTIFFSASSAIVTADYYLVAKRKFNIPDLFVGDPSSIYWYRNGVHWIAIFALVFAMSPSFPGLVFSITGVSNVWTRIFQINYVVCAPLGALTYMALCWWKWPPGRGVQVEMDEQDMERRSSADESTSDEETSIGVDEKTYELTEIVSKE